MTADIQAAKERLTLAGQNVTNVMVMASDLRTILAELSRLEGENERLRLTILGGEDAPGYAASLPIEAVEEAHRENMASWHADTDTVLAMEAALTSDEEPDDYVPTPQQRAEDYSRWARATYKSYREWLERATNAEVALAEARCQIAERDAICREVAALQHGDGGRSFPSADLCARAAALLSKGGEGEGEGLVFSHCHACAQNDEGVDGHDPGVGCPAGGPSDGCEGVLVKVAALSSREEGEG